MAKTKEQTERQLRYALDKERALVKSLNEQIVVLKRKINYLTLRKKEVAIKEFYVKCEVRKVDPKFGEFLFKILSEECDIPLDALTFKSRRREIILARHVGCYVVYNIYRKFYRALGLRDVALYFGYENHTTVLHAIESVSNKLSLIKHPDYKIVTRILARVEKFDPNA